MPASSPDGELEVAVLLHVEVHEGGWRRRHRPLVENTEPVLDAFGGVVECPEVDLAGDGRDLDRHVVDPGVVDQPEGLLEAPSGLTVSEHGLAQQVDVEVVALGPAFGQVCTTLPGFGVDDQVADHGAHATSGQRHDEPRQQRCEPGADVQGHAVERAEESGKAALGDEVGQFAGGGPIVAVAGHPVDEAHRECHAVGVGDEPGESVAEGPFGAGLVGTGQVDPVGYEGDGVLGEAAGVVRGVT